MVRRQVSWLADQARRPPSQSALTGGLKKSELQWRWADAFRSQLRGQLRIKASARTAFPINPSLEGTVAGTVTARSRLVNATANALARLRKALLSETHGGVTPPDRAGAREGLTGTQ
jgi:hypothetical protein